MPMCGCDIENCLRPAVRTLGDRVLCDRHLCSQHLQAGFHDCPKLEDAETYVLAAREAERKEMERLLEKVDTQTLAAHASRLRQGIPCSVPALQYDREKRSSVTGGMNCHLDIHFEDGMIWMARIHYIIQSEVSSLRFLERTSVPAPRVFDYALEGANNPVGVGYVLIEKMPGSSLQWSLASSQQRNKVMEQLGNILVELHRYPFDRMGCLDRIGSSHVGSFARESLTDFDESHMLTLGPYSSLEEYHVASIRLILNLIIREELYTERSVDAYLIHRFLLDLVPSILPRSAGEGMKFFLKHADDKGDHVLVDEEYNITECIAFNSPAMLLPVSDFYKGVNELGNEEAEFARIFERKGYPGLAEIVRQGRLQHRFAFCCEYDLADWSGFLGLFRGLRDAIGVDHDLSWDDRKKSL
ncbi:hypothetical protein BDY21DRAFT_387682 [Lineolata rhizophorae]|uniref:Aminoglycoside phosphotransferase domain-containing protein n=1 Tax=Lineolata rhizophorae TaxID=578093 RepID=A0A6A6NR66_9PEZI|nr:hypothetical protein BDY21DRAFT_387682 [Lineolata rhizophorae]